MRVESGAPEAPLARCDRWSSALSLVWPRPAAWLALLQKGRSHATSPSNTFPLPVGECAAAAAALCFEGGGRRTSLSPLGRSSGPGAGGQLSGGTLQLSGDAGRAPRPRAGRAVARWALPRSAPGRPGAVAARQTSLICAQGSFRPAAAVGQRPQAPARKRAQSRGAPRRCAAMCPWLRRGSGRPPPRQQLKQRQASRRATTGCSVRSAAHRPCPDPRSPSPPSQALFPRPANMADWAAQSEAAQERPR